MEIKYSYHARRVKMPQRRISVEEVEAVIAEPDFETPAYTPAGGDPRSNLWRRLRGRLLRVTVAQAGESLTVVTVVAPEEEDEGE